jgi:glycosyltransferase involved in cell wall biosynthesis
MYDFKNILFVGPEDTNGGMGAVIRSYEKMSDHFHFIATHSKSSPAFYPFFILKLFRVIKYLHYHKEIKVVHIHSASNGSFIRKSIILLLAKIFDKRVVFHIHGGGFILFYNRNTILAKYILYILNRADLIFCLSLDWKKMLIELPIKTKIEVLNNPVDSYSGIRDEYKGGLLKLIFIGNIISSKGIFKLLDYLFSSTFFKNGQISLTIAGLGQVQELEECLKMCKYQNQITYLGWINQEIKVNQLYSHHILILPSSYEGLPVSILESFSSSMPVIATRVGGIPDIVYPHINGWLFDPSDFSELDSIFTEIFNNPEIVNLYGSVSHQLVRPYFLDNVKETLLQHYSSLI